MDWDEEWPHEVTVKRYEGTSGAGVPVLGGPETMPCLVDRRTRLVRSASGDQVVSSATVYAPLDWQTVPAGSDIDGHTVLAVAAHTAGTAFTDLACCEFALT